jgi:hypothetical protein
MNPLIKHFLISCIVLMQNACTGRNENRMVSDEINSAGSIISELMTAIRNHSMYIPVNNSRRAFNRILDHVNRGLVTLRVILARMHERGVCVEQCLSKPVKWYEIAAYTGWQPFYMHHISVRIFYPACHTLILIF